MEITKEEYQQWKSNNVTQFIFKELKERKEDYIVALRTFVRAGDMNLASRAEGMIESIDDFLDTSFEDPTEDDEDA
ncbi:MAG: hypothetical protein JKY96_04410 [Phycisphaerales bacterium]|nr:hypothetical protein [Phycisphaerales bacterium]